MNYDYKCEQCNSELTVERSIHAEASDPMCFNCHTTMNRVWSSPPVTFNGAGFYSTDYKK
jgi:putative FmdB family regulatory protein